MSTNNLKNYVIVLILTIVLSLVTTLPLGIFSFLFSALLAAVIGYTVSRHHYALVGITCCFAIIIYTIFSHNILSALTTALPILLCGITLGIAHNIKLSDFMTVSVLSGIYVIYLLLNVKLLGVNENNQNFFEASLNTSFDMYKEVLTTAYGNAVSIAEIEKIMANLYEIIRQFMPSIIIIFCFAIGLLYYFVFKKVLTATKTPIEHYTPFSDWHAENSFGIVFLIVLILNTLSPENSYAKAAFSNVFAISIFIFFIFGLSVVFSLLKKRLKNTKIQKIIMTLITIILVFSFGIPSFLISVLGFADTFFDFRKNRSKENLTE